MRQKLAARDLPAQPPRHRQILAFLENEIGLAALKRNEHAEAARRFEAAIELDARNAPAYLNLGDVRFLQGDAAAASATWERLVEMSPERAYLAFSRLEAAYGRLEGAAPRSNDAARFPALCRRLVGANPQDWRARLALARYHTAHGHAHDALELLFEALVINPHALALHQAIWETLSAPAALPRARRPLRRPHARRHLLPRSPHLRPLPLPEHGAALAVPALPRVGHVRRRAHRARQGHGSDADELRRIVRSWFLVLGSWFRSRSSFSNRERRTERTCNEEPRTENQERSPRAVPPPPSASRAAS